MKRRNVKHLISTAAGIALFGAGSVARAQLIVDGTLDGGYGSALAVQTVNTQYGNSTAGDGTSNGGSELDAAYANISNGTLYLFLAGNLQNNGNKLNIFIADGRTGGQNVLSASASSGSLHSANGLTFPTGFNATYALDVNVSGSTAYLDHYDLVNNSANYLGSVGLTGGIGSSQNVNGVALGVNNTNAAGVSGGTGAADPTAAQAVTTGIEVGIPLAALGNPSSVQIMADINNSGDNSLSNQFLPGLPAGYGNLGTASSVNLATNGSGIVPFSVTAPSTPDGTWLPTGSGSWNTAGNWSNSNIPNGSTASVNFLNATGSSTVSLDTPITVNNISFNTTNSYTLASNSVSGTLTTAGTSPVITIYNGAQTISAPLILSVNTALKVPSHGATLTVTGNITGPGALTTFDQGAGGTQFLPSLIILSGSNTYTGGTVVDGGNLQLASATALPSATALTLDAQDLPSGVLDLNSFSVSLSSLSVTTGPNTQSLGSVGKIINTNSSAGTATITFAGNVSSPSVFAGQILDSSGTGGNATSLLVTSGSLTLSNTNSYAGGTNVAGGSLTIAATNALPFGGNLNIASGATVVATNLGTENPITVGSLGVVGKLDLDNNALVVRNSNLSSVSAMVASGFNQGNWNGSTGIVSTTAASDPTHLTTLGVIVNNTDGSTPLFGSSQSLGMFEGLSPNATDVLVKYTYFGDANLDGQVTSADYTLIDNGFLTHLTGWYNGDFNYDNVINGSDYTLIDNAFNTQGVSLAAQIASPTAQIAGANTAVPEPASLSLLGIGAAALLGRRRRHN